MPSAAGTAPLIDAEPLFRLKIEVAPPQDLGTIDGCRRRFMPITGGSVSGTLQGEILPGGGDWQRIAPDGSIEIDARYVLAIGNGRIEVHSTGVRAGPPEILARLAAGEPVPASDYYFRSAFRFTSGDAALSFLNHVLAVGYGARSAAGVEFRIHRVL